MDAERIWVRRFDGPAHRVLDGALRVAVKDAIDVAGVVTTAGCRAVADTARPAARDADCLAAFRGDGIVLLGKTNLDELCVSASGRNDWLGMPVNPLDPTRIPGGSSSGSAVAVARGQADIGLGTDTGGSVRIPAACCGVAGLKTTWGRIPLGGVWPLSPSLDTLGPLARDVAGLVRAMELLDPGWAGPGAPARTVGRIRVDGVDEAYEAAVDDALGAAAFAVRDIELPGWDDSFAIFDTVLTAEFAAAHSGLLDAADVGAHARRALRAGTGIGTAELAEAHARRRAWAAAMTALFGEVDVLALPTLSERPSRIAADHRSPRTWLTAPVNVAGLPAVSLPLPRRDEDAIPPSLQLIGPAGGEELLCASAARVETALIATASHR